MKEQMRVGGGGERARENIRRNKQEIARQVKRVRKWTNDSRLDASAM